MFDTLIIERRLAKRETQSAGSYDTPDGGRVVASPNRWHMTHALTATVKTCMLPALSSLDA